MTIETPSATGAVVLLREGSDAAKALGGALGTLLVPVTSAEPECGVYWVDFSRFRPSQIDALVAIGAQDGDAVAVRQEMLDAGVYLEASEVTGAVGQDGIVSVSVSLKAETVAEIEQLRTGCAPGRVTFEQMMGMLIETGLVAETVRRKQGEHPPP